MRAASQQWSDHSREAGTGCQELAWGEAQAEVEYRLGWLRVGAGEGRHLEF